MFRRLRFFIGFGQVWGGLWGRVQEVGENRKETGKKIAWMGKRREERIEKPIWRRLGAFGEIDKAAFFLKQVFQLV